MFKQILQPSSSLTLMAGPELPLLLQHWEERCCWFSVTWTREGNPNEHRYCSVYLWQAALPAHGLCSGTDGCLGIVQGERWSHLWSLGVLGRSLVSSWGPGRCWEFGSMSAESSPHALSKVWSEFWAGGAQSSVPSCEQEGWLAVGCGGTTRAARGVLRFI